MFKVRGLIKAFAMNYVFKCSEMLLVCFASGAIFSPLPWSSYNATKVTFSEHEANATESLCAR